MAVKRISRLIPALVIGAVFGLTFLGPMLIGVEVPGFRDSAYLYYPLFEWIDEEWKTGHVPLWNPYCNLGIPVVGDHSSSVFYPGKLIFFLRMLPFPMRYGLYISGHYFLAAIGTFWLARVLGANTAGATLSAITYSGGGCLLSLASNVIFLVGAAWLPVALGCTWFAIRGGQISWAVRAGMCAALMILGGDPQMAYHVFLIFAASMAGWWVRGRCLSSCHRSREFSGGLVRRVVAFGVMIVTAGLLALVQIWPTLEWARLSERVQPDQPISLWQTISPNENSDLEARLRSLLKTPEPGTVGDHVYQFSLPPWSLGELLFPNASGKLYPTHQRWTEGLSEPDRVWYPSLYVGWITMWLAVRGLRWKGNRSSAWLSRIAIFFLLGSLGSYGLGWLLSCEEIGTQVGGVYWLMNVLLPKYAAFRYPAKLMVVASLCFSLLAGLQLRKISPIRWRPFKTFIGLATCGLSLVVMIGVTKSDFILWMFEIPDDPLLGPFDVSGASILAMLAVVQPVFLILPIWFLGASARIIRMHQKIGKNFNPCTARTFCHVSIWVVVVVTACDLVIANRWILGLVPSEVFTMDVDSPWTKALDPIDVESAGPITLYRPRDGMIPAHWRNTRSEYRLQEIVQWQRETCDPKHHLSGKRIRVVGSFASIWPAQYEELLQRMESPQLDHIAQAPDTAISSKRDTVKQEYCDGELILQNEEGKSYVDCRLWGNPPQMIVAATFDEGRLHEIPAVEIRLTRFGSSELVAYLATNLKCMIIYKSIWDGNWAASVKETSTGREYVEELRELLPGRQGIEVEPGTYQVRLFYQPTGLWKAMIVSALAWAAVVVGLACCGFPKFLNLWLRGVR